MLDERRSLTSTLAGFSVTAHPEFRFCAAQDDSGHRIQGPAAVEDDGRGASRRLTHMRYTPRPIDTAGVELPTGIGSLVERLAKHNHDVWARQRLKDGWSFGPVRNDDRKEHPCLVPYADLPESEKDYDRKTALEALKAIVALGYRIVPADEAGAE